MNYYQGPWNNGAFIGFHILGFLVFLVLVGVVIWFCVVGRFYHRHHISTESSDSAIEIVKQRYAKGEISKGEYDKILKDLK